MDGRRSIQVMCTPATLAPITQAPAAGHRATTCPRCGGTFACGVGAGRDSPCFCVAYALRAERLAELRARWSDCLCADCLAALAREPERPA
jgi:hypothetical protein